MARSETLKIYISTYTFVQEVFKTTVKFPREYKFCLGDDMNKDALSLLKHIFQANQHQHKRAHLDNFMAAFETVRVELRLCADLKILSVKKQAHLALLMDEIAKQAAAWKKYETNLIKQKGEINQPPAGVGQNFELAQASSIKF